MSHPLGPGGSMHVGSFGGHSVHGSPHIFISHGSHGFGGMHIPSVKGTHLPFGSHAVPIMNTHIGSFGSHGMHMAPHSLP